MGFFREVNHETYKFFPSYPISCLVQLLRITSHKFYIWHSSLSFFVSTFSIYLRFHPLTLSPFYYTPFQLTPTLRVYHKGHSLPLMVEHGGTFLLVDFSGLMIDTPQLAPPPQTPPPPPQLAPSQLSSPSQLAPPPPLQQNCCKINRIKF